MLAPPVNTISQSSDTIYSSFDAASYDWYLDSVLVSTTSDPFLVITQPGNYYSVVNDSMTCPRVSNVLTAIILSTQNLPGDEFYIINNNDFHSVTIINKTIENDFGVSMTDMTGKLIYKQEFHGRRNEINLETIPAGIYLLNIKSDDRIFSKKIIKN